jgi:hypothetical protein
VFRCSGEEGLFGLWPQGRALVIGRLNYMANNSLIKDWIKNNHSSQLAADWLNVCAPDNQAILGSGEAQHSEPFAHNQV